MVEILNYADGVEDLTTLDEVDNLLFAISRSKGGFWRHMQLIDMLLDIRNEIALELKIEEALK